MAGHDEPEFAQSVTRRVHVPRRPQQEDACDDPFAEVLRAHALKRMELERLEWLIDATEARVRALFPGTLPP